MEKDSQDENQLDAKESAKSWVNVAKKRKNPTTVFWLIGGAAAVLFVLMFSSHHKKALTSTLQNNINHDYTSSLDANLAHLRAMREAKDTPQPPSFSYKQGLDSIFKKPKVSKEYLERQNAPTSMYTGQSINRSFLNHTSDVKQATLVGGDMDSDFANANDITTTVQAKKIAHPNFSIASGEFLHAVLETAINSDLPGMVRAVVSKPVYSYTGEYVLIPAGSRLIGQYSSSILQGQNRVMIMWNRVVLPNGIAVQINSPGSDYLGRGGQGADSVNTHFIARFSQAALLSIIGAGTATVGVGSGDQYNSAAQYRTAISQSFQQSAGNSLQGMKPMKPTIHIYQGENINVFVSHDLSFYRVLKNQMPLPAPAPSFVK